MHCHEQQDLIVLDYELPYGCDPIALLGQTAVQLDAEGAPEAPTVPATTTVITDLGSVATYSVSSKYLVRRTYLDEERSFLTPHIETVAQRLSHTGRPYDYWSMVETPASTDPDALEARLVTDFEKIILEDMDMNPVPYMVPIEGQTIREPYAFAFVPLIANDRMSKRSIQCNEHGIPTASGSHVKYGGAYGEYPRLDSLFAIGLEYYNLVIAVAACGVDYDGVLRINQIQAVADKRERGKEGYERFASSSGLMHGFLWRDTLVRGLESIAARIGCPAVIIQSHENNKWEAIRNHGASGYDEVAKRLGYDPLPNHDWIKYLDFVPNIPR